MKKIFLAVVLAFCGFNYASAQTYQTKYDYEYYNRKPYVKRSFSCMFPC